MKQAVIISFLCASILPHISAPVFAQAADEKRYARCLDMTERTPDKAINLALVWQGENGGVPARHCEAVGLFQMGEFAESAARLERIAEDMRIGRDMPIRRSKRIVAGPEMLADMYGQAANAWLYADETVNAEAAVNTALEIAPKGTTQYADLQLMKAQVFAADGSFSAALQLIEQAIALDTERKGILIFAASSARSSGDYIKAQKYLDEYQKLFPDNPTAFLERGNLEDAMGQFDLARKSWLKVIELAPNSIDADAARANLERLDLQVKD